MNLPALFISMANYVKTTVTGKIILAVVILLLFLIIALPLIRRLKRRRIKEKETREIMKDLLTWRHLAQLVKGGGGHQKAKQELSDNIIRINDLLKQGFRKFARKGRELYENPWFVLVGEPRSGKSSLLEASGLELEPSAVERDATDDGKNSLPVRIWSGTKAAVCDISGKVFFDRWLEGSSAEWNYITRQICRYRRKRPLDGIIVTIPADALLADNADLSSHKAILMANELHDLLRNCGMNLPCYVIVTKLDMVNGFQDYSKFLEGDLRHQILGFTNNAKFYNKQKFEEFRETLRERLVAGAKQLIIENTRKTEQSPGTRMDTAAKIWTFPDTFAALNENIKIYLDALFGEDNYHGTNSTFFEGIYFTSAKDMYISLSPAMAGLSGLPPDELIIPGSAYYGAAYTEQPVPANPAADNTLMAIPGRQLTLSPVNRRPDLRRGYFIRDVFHKRIFRESEHVSFTKRKALALHLPHYVLCAALTGTGLYWGLTALFNADKLYTNLLQTSTYYSYLDGILQKGTPFYSPLVREDPPGRFFVDMSPIAGESLSSRVQFFYNAVTFRDMAVAIPPGFGLSWIVTDGFQPNYSRSTQKHLMPIIVNRGLK
jgi:type VI protein secretion system component VasK